MTKFKVGDKVRLLNGGGYYPLHGFKNGEVYKVAGKTSDTFSEDTRKRIKIKVNDYKGYALPENLELIESKPTKNQRIAALEKEVAELRPLKEKIEYLEKAVQQYFTVPGEPSTAVEEVSTSTVGDKPKLKGITIELEKTPNQQRKEIIEKAKEFSEIEQYRRKRDGKFVVKSTVDPFNWGVRNIRFEVNDKKRTVVLLVLGEFGNVVDRHIAKCHPSDVFNEHIGKAIALGRALGLAVSEFEQAVQPTEVVVGMIVQDYYKFKEEYITEIDNSLNFEYINEKIECYRKGVLNHNSFNARIINDTNAIYGGGE